MAHQPVSLRTIADLARFNHGLRADCWRCGRCAELDLQQLIRDGRGDLPYRRVRVRCTQCGEPGRIQLVAPVPFSARWAKSAPGALSHDGAGLLCSRWNRVRTGALIRCEALPATGVFRLARSGAMAGRIMVGDLSGRRKEKPRLPGTFPWHSATSHVYHDNADCKAGSSIPRIYRREGTGGRHLCPLCAEINDTEREAHLGRRSRQVSG